MVSYVLRFNPQQEDWWLRDVFASAKLFRPYFYRSSPISGFDPVNICKMQDRNMADIQEDYAGRVFLLMGKEYRISRSIRAQWFFQHINSLVFPKSNQDLLSSREELEVLSVLPEVTNIHSAHSFRLAPSTRITFIGRQYRFVFCLDISPSEGTVNVVTGKTLLEEVFDNFMNCILGLIEPFSVPGSSLVLAPELVVTVLAHTPLAHKTCQVLVQGLTISRHNIYDVLYEVKSKLQTLEDLLSNEMTKKYEQSLASEADAGENGNILNSAEAILHNMVRDALLALQLLPDNASAGLVIVTDGVFNLNDASVVDAILAQMRTSTVVCSFLHVGGGASCGFGYIPHTSLMQFIATATSGAYMCSCPRVNTTDLKQEVTANEIHEAQPMNLYHEAFLCWNFHTGADRGKIAHGSAIEKVWPSKSHVSKEKYKSLLFQPQQKIKHSEYKHSTRISSVLSVRLREGYSIENVAISRDGTELQVKLTLPWKEHVLLEYTAKAAWPLDQLNRSTHVDVIVQGSYEFLVDITSKQKCKSSYRETVVEKFEQTMRSLQATDESLVRLQSFSNNPSYTTIPDSAKDGVPLFHLPQSSKTPVLSLQQGKSKKSAKSHEAQFAEYWKPILYLDTKTWQKWFHCHRVSILLENDRPISKSMFMPSSADRFHTVHYRTATNALNRMLRDWASFVLLENHSYIRFLESSNQKAPYSFCLLRLVFKGLCVVIRLAFLGGTAGTERHRIVSELKELLNNIKAPLKKPLFSPEHTLSSSSPSKSVTLQTKEKRCFIFLEKPLERILVKYECIPDDLKSVEYKSSDDDEQESLDITRSSSRMSPVRNTNGMSTSRTNAVLRALSRYMYNQRWIWKMSCQTKALPTGAVAGVLYALTKRRLLEGFHFCSSNQNGIITMVKEVPMQRHTSNEPESGNVCVLQFVLFPPHRCTQTRDGFHDESVESDAIRDVKSELQFATEIWVEPQSGVVRGSGNGFKYIEGLKYNEIPQKIFLSDLQTVKEMVTYSHLEGMCIDSLLTTVPPSLSGEIRPPFDWFKNSAVVDVPFLFDIVSLLEKSKQICMMLPLLKNVEDEITCGEQRPNDTLLSLFFSSVTDLIDCEVPLTSSNCEAFSSLINENCNEDQGSGPETKPRIQLRDQPAWKCYAGASRRSIIILFIPATLDDVEKVHIQRRTKLSSIVEEVSVKNVNTEADLNEQAAMDGNKETNASVTITESEAEGEGDDVTAENDSVKELRDSVYGEENDLPTSSKRPYLPIFIYECKFSTISDIRSEPGELQSMFMDYTTKLGAYHAENTNEKARTASEDTSERSTELSVFCKTLSDRFFQTFVNGVFRNLQLGFVLNSDDVESSVEMICEESCLEIDITSFIRIICMHFRREQIDDDVFESILESNLVIKRPGKHSSGSTSKSTPRTPITTMPKCGSETVHKFVQNSFLEILQTKFSRVPQNGELFYYNASDDQQNEKDDESISEAESDIQEADLQVANDIFGSTENLPTDAKEDDDDVIDEHDDNISNLSRVSVKGSTNSLSAIETADELSDVESVAFEEADTASSQHPLFLHLMCSIRDRSLTGSEIGLIHVNTLPTCLAEIVRTLEDGGNLISPASSSLKVTLDLICLTLPPEMDSAKSWKVVDEGTLAQDASEMEEGFLVDEHGSIADDQFKQGVFELNEDKEIVSAPREKASTLIDNTLTDPLKTLPKAQLNAFKVIVKRIEWLLKDEIASALINVSPVTEATLDNVADHVKNSTTDNCQFRRISLRFVCGLEKSLQLFLVELSEARINNYRLVSKGKYFYLSGGDSDVHDTAVDISKSNELNSDLLHETAIGERVEDADVTGVQQNEEQEDQAGIHETDMESGELLADVDTAEVIKAADDFSVCSDEDDTYHFCKQIIVDAIELSLPSRRECLWDDSARSRSGSLPLPVRGNGDIVRRRFSDTGISYTKSEDLSLNFEDFTVELQEFQQRDTPRKIGPDFWLFASVQGSEVIVFHHKRREAVDSSDIQSEKCYIDLLGMINTIGRLVNQKMLLDDLYETFTCHNLLVAEEDEQIWSRRESSPAKQLFVTGKSEMGMSFEIVKVVHGEFEFHPGYFECDKVWETFLPVHYRLKSSPGQPKGTSRGIQAVRAVLEKFAVLNRSNLFVYRESSGSVFYFRIHEMLSEAEATPLTNVAKINDEEIQLKEDNFSYHSAASSSWSLAGRVQQEEKQDLQDDSDAKEPEGKFQRGNSLLTQVEKDSVSELSFSTVMSVQRIQFCVHGICEPGSEIKDELVRVLKNKLNDAVFEQLNLLIARNPKCRLAPSDVQFIQPPGQAPATKIHIAIPKIALPYTHSTIYYLRQYLLQRFHTPRFTENSPEFHFKNYCGNVSSFASDEPLPLNDVYLYNRREKKGFGIGCIHMSLIDSDHKPVHIFPTNHRVRPDVFEAEFYLHTFQEFNNVKTVEEIKPDQADDDLYLEFKVWERGSIGIEELQQFLVSDVRKALSDIFLEFIILFTPISEVPSNLQSFYFSKIHSRSSQTTTPTSLKNNSRSTTPVSSTPYPRLVMKKFLSEPATPAELRARSPVVFLRNRSLNEIPVKEPLSRKSSKESPREVAKKSQLETIDNIERTYETLEEYFPLNPSENRSSSTRKSDSDEASVRETVSSTSDSHVVSVREVERLLPAVENTLSSPYDTLTDKEVEESFSSTVTETDDSGKDASDRKEPTWKEIERRKRYEKEARRVRRRFERGEVGVLHPCFDEGISLVLDEFITQESTSVHKHTGSLKCKYTPDQILKEILKIFNDLASDIKPKIFKEASSPLRFQTNCKETVVFAPYSFDRNAVKIDDYGESSTDTSSVSNPVSVVPGYKTSFIAVGRNIKQWRQCVNLNESISDEDEKGTSSAGFSKQMFRPLDPDANYSIGRPLESLAPSCIKLSFVPRQKFYIVKYVDREIVTFTYNFPVEVNAMLDKQLNRLYAWHNARTHLASSLVVQKLGLFHHLYFTEEKQKDEEIAAFCSSTSHSHIISLLKETFPSSKEKTKSGSSDASKMPGIDLPSLDETFRNTSPAKPLHKENYRLSNDPVKRIGYQYQEITRTKINVESQRSKLREIWETWHVCGPHMPIYENRLSLLKRHSRLIHFCQTPLLFNPSDNIPTEQKSKSSESEQSQKSKKADETDSRDTKQTMTKDETSGGAKHEWYGELKWTVMQKYIQYLQTLGFCVVQVQPNTKGQQAKLQKGSSMRASSKSVNEAVLRTRPSVQYLQKSSNAGILLLELSYRRDNLCLRMFSYEASRLKLLNRFVTMHDHWLFQEDCNRCKDLMHIHSFSYDFQLRQAQQFLSGRNMIFYPGYPVQHLFQRMIEIFPSPPKFSCCYLAQGTVSIPCSAELETKEVFKYLSINAERYKMDPAKITKVDDSGMKLDPSVGQTMLSYMYYTSKSQNKGEFQKMTSGSRRDTADFDGNVILTLSPSQDKEVLNLKFFLVLTNRREFYPRRSLKCQLSSLRSRRKRTFSGNERPAIPSSSDEIQILGAKPRVRFSMSTNDSSVSEDVDQPQERHLKVPTWPGTLPPNESSSPKAIASPSSDTSLLRVKDMQTEYGKINEERMARSPSSDPHLPRSSSNDSISSSGNTHTMMRKSSSSGQLAEKTELADANFLATEVAFVRSRLSKVAGTCLSNCWRDFMWYKLLLMDCGDEETAARRNKRKPDTRKESLRDEVHNWKLAGVLNQIRKEVKPKISMSEIKLLLGLVALFPISAIDKRMDTLLTLLGNSKPQPQRQSISRVLSGRFGDAFREFTSEDLPYRYICLLNQFDLDMFVMVTIGTEGNIQDIQAVYREEPRWPPTKDVTFAELKKNESHAVEHIENVMSCICYNVWSHLLPNQ